MAVTVTPAAAATVVEQHKGLELCLATHQHDMLPAVMDVLLEQSDGVGVYTSY